MTVANTIKKYLPHLNVSLDSIKVHGLSIMMNRIYTFGKLTINKTPYLLVHVNAQNVGPREFKRHKILLEEKSGLPLIWFLRELHVHKITRMIRNGMNFIIGEKQIHLPIVNTSLQFQQIKIRPNNQPLNPLAINILSRQILRDDLTKKKKHEIANILDVNQMAVTRAIDTLIQNNLCEEIKEGTSKIVIFEEKEDLWEHLKNKIQTPIKEIIYFGETLSKELPYSGITALSKLTMLADDEIPTFAIYRTNFNKEYDKKDAVLEEFAKCKIEIWDWKPILIEKDCINPIDIYLLHKDDEDERVQIELETLMKRYGINI